MISEKIESAPNWIGNVFGWSVIFIPTFLVMFFPVLAMIIFSALWIFFLPKIVRHVKNPLKLSTKELFNGDLQVLALASFIGFYIALSEYKCFMTLILWSAGILVVLFFFWFIIYIIISSKKENAWRKKHSSEIELIRVIQDQIDNMPYIPCFGEKTQDEEKIYKQMEELSEKAYVLEKQIGLHNTKAFKRGMASAKLGIPITKNPYDYHIEKREWEDGWYEWNVGKIESNDVGFNN